MRKEVEREEGGMNDGVEEGREWGGEKEGRKEEEEGRGCRGSE